MHTVQLLDPFAGVGFDELFHGHFKPVRAARRVAAAIKVDVTESNDGYVVHAEIPGVSRDDIQVTIEGNQVTIAAEVKKSTVEKSGDATDVDAKSIDRVLRSERYFGAVHRSFVLPVELDEATSQAKYENGVLELKLAKKPALAGRKLTVQ